MFRMLERPEDSSTKELLYRISQLETAMAVFTEKLDKAVRHNSNMHRLNIQHRELIESDLVDAFERIKNIELKVFPNLAEDIIHLNDIIGEGNGKAWNPLDQRKR